MKCEKCNYQVQSNSRFCTQCGDEIVSMAVNPDADTNVFWMKGKTLKTLTKQFNNWLDSNGYEHQYVKVDDATTLVQIKRKGRFGRLVGMGAAIQVFLTKNKDQLKVKLGKGKWMDKIIPAGISLVVLWPLAVTAGIGAHRQYHLPKKIWQFFEQELKIV